MNTGAISDFLVIPGTDTQGEGGLLGLAFHPDFAKLGTQGFGRFYVYVTIDNGGVSIDGLKSPYSSHIREYRIMSDDANSADPSSAKEIVSWVKPTGVHNGGWMGFNPVTTPGQPQYLYITSGDGGVFSGFEVDIPNHAQTIVDEKLGKILRLDINGDDFPDDEDRNYAIPQDNPFVGKMGDDEIWAYGLRNPWRASFDRQTGDLWIGDVGWSRHEEIDYQPADWPGGANYGWRLREGNTQTPGSSGGPEPADYVPPVYDYGHNYSGTFSPFEGNSVIGGYIYRGPDPDLQGKYIFGDFVSDSVWQFDPQDPLGSREDMTGLLVPDSGSFESVASFSEDPVGNLYIVDYSGKVFRVATDRLIAGDYNADGEVDENDYNKWVADFGTSNPEADGNGNGVVDAADYVLWRTNKGKSVHNVANASDVGRSRAIVPEPSTASTAIFVFGLLLARRRREHFCKRG